MADGDTYPTVWGAGLTEGTDFVRIPVEESGAGIELIGVTYAGLVKLVANGTPEMVSWLTYFLGTMPTNMDPMFRVLTTTNDSFTG